MKQLFNILIVACCFLSCQDAEADSTLNEPEVVDNGQIYVNEHGQVELNQINDTTWQTIFTNNEGFIYDTTLSANNAGGFFRFRDSNAVYLPYNWGGINFTESELFVIELSSYGMLATEAQMWEMYERSFFRIGQEIEFQGEVHPEKDGLKANGMYFEIGEQTIEPAFYNITGTIKKERYPIDYYSTDESPQGKFGNDTTIAHYRLILENPTFELPETYIYEGSKVNTSSNQACIAWDWADSEAYYLEGHELWSDDEVGEHIKVEGYLSQNGYGSVLKNWKIIE